MQGIPYKRCVANILNTADVLFSVWTGMCVLAGCDFLPSISGIGTKRAYSLISKYKDINHVRMITLVLFRKLLFRK